MVTIGAEGLPVIRSGNNAPAASMGLDALLALEQQALTREDIQRGGFAG